jgi:hypothetical protein
LAWRLKHDSESRRTENAKGLERTNGEGFQVAPDAEPLEFLMAVFRDNRQPMNRRMKAAEAAAQYRHAKLGVVATTSFDGKDFASLLEKAILRGRGIGEPQVKVIEHRPAEAQEKAG